MSRTTVSSSSKRAEHPGRQHQRRRGYPERRDGFGCDGFLDRTGLQQRHAALHRGWDDQRHGRNLHDHALRALQFRRDTRKSPLSLTFGSGSGGVQDGTGNSYTGGTLLERGTLEIATATGAGAGPIEFVPDNHLQVLQINSNVLVECYFCKALNGLGVGSVVDLAGTLYQLFESATVADGRLDVEAPAGQVVASGDLGSAGASGLSFVALPDLRGGTAVVALPDQVVAAAVSGLEKSFGVPLSTILADVASTSLGAELVSVILEDLGGPLGLSAGSLAHDPLASNGRSVGERVGGAREQGFGGDAAHRAALLLTRRAAPSREQGKGAAPAPRRGRSPWNPSRLRRASVPRIGAAPRGRGARAVDRGGLENRCACKRTVGSNPTLSARRRWSIMRVRRSPRTTAAAHTPRDTIGTRPGRIRIADPARSRQAALARLDAADLSNAGSRRTSPAARGVGSQPAIDGRPAPSVTAQWMAPRRARPGRFVFRRTSPAARTARGRSGPTIRSSGSGTFESSPTIPGREAVAGPAGPAQLSLAPTRGTRPCRPC